MNSVIVIILSFLLGNFIYSDYITIFYFNKLDEKAFLFDWKSIFFYVLVVLGIVYFVYKEKNQGLKLIQIGIVISMITYFGLSAMNAVEYFRTHNIRFYHYEG